MKQKIRLGLFFGGRSPEHEISVITALQAAQNLAKNKYEIIPVYINKSGEFYTNPKFLELKNFKDIVGLLLSSTKVILGNKNNQGGLYAQGRLFTKFIPFDVALPLLHGSFGENGSIQGMFEMYQIPYSGFGVLGSAIGMDKLASKLLFQALNLPIGKYVSVNRFDWQNNQARCLAKIKKSLRWPLFVKPNTVGSSIGIGHCKDMDQLSFNIEVAAIYSDKIIIEEAFENIIEVNCSALGYHNPQASVCEQPISTNQILSFDDKYRKGGKQTHAGMASASRIIPAPITKMLGQEIQKTTIEIFKALDGCGIARVDYFVDPKKEKFWVNEINTIPGSLSFYLWKPKGITYTNLLDLIIRCALERAKDQQRTQFIFESGLLSELAGVGGIKS